MNQYAHRPRREIMAHYAKHVQAMTAEGLHEKSDIAAELAWRDKRIEELEAALREAAAYADAHNDYLHWMALVDWSPT